MVPSKTYLIPVEEGDLESLVDRCLERAFKKRIAALPVVENSVSADELLTPEETAKILKVSKVTVWDWSKRGILNKHHIGNQVRYLRSEVIAAATGKGAVAK